jgi:hypothetical protein
MSNEAHIVSLDALERIDGALGRFASRALDIVEDVEREIQRITLRLDDRENDLQRSLAYWRDEYRYASNDEEGDGGDSAAYEIERIEGELQELSRWRDRVEACSSSFSRYGSRLKELAVETTPKAQMFLRQKLSELQAHLAIQLPGSAALNTGRVHLASTGNSAATGATMSPLPKGYSWMSLDKIDLKEIPQNMPYAKASYEIISKGFDVLKDKVLPAMTEDPSRTRDYFIDLDLKAGQAYPGETAKVYEAFFGDDPIHVQKGKSADLYTIDSGRHRIDVARTLGWGAVPVKTS